MFSSLNTGFGFVHFSPNRHVRFTATLFITRLKKISVVCVLVELYHVFFFTYMFLLEPDHSGACDESSEPGLEK